MFSSLPLPPPHLFYYYSFYLHLNHRIEVVTSWLNSMDENGWMEREQILGDEARSKVFELPFSSILFFLLSFHFILVYFISFDFITYIILMLGASRVSNTVS